jgi:hypothetical protein
MQPISFCGFEDGSMMEYTTDGGGTRITTDSQRACQGDVSVRLRRQSNLYTQLAWNVTSYSDFILNFRYFSVGVESNDALLVDYSDDEGKSWKRLRRIQMGEEHAVPLEWNSKCHETTIVFSDVLAPRGVNTAAIDTLQIRIQADANHNRDQFFIDDIRLEGILPYTILTRGDICPLNKMFPSQQYEILPFPDTTGLVHVEDDLSEISSLAFSSYTDDDNNTYAYVASDKNQFSLKVIKFTNSDAANSTAFSMLSGTADTIAVYRLTNINFDNDDWEDISTGPCSADSDNDSVCIYIGNFGNNNRGGHEGNDYEQRNKVNIFKFPEPLFEGANSTPISRNITASIIHYDYDATFNLPDTVFVDAEAMFVDWTGAKEMDDNNDQKGDIYVVSKGGCGRGVGRIAASLHSDLLPGEEIDVGSMERISLNPPPQGSFGCKTPGSAFRVYQGADMSRNGRMIALSTGASPARTYFFPRETGQSVKSALTSSSCDYVVATSFGLENEKKHEAVAFLDDEGTIFAEASECTDGRDCKVPVYFHQLTFDPPQSGRTILLEGIGWQAITYDDFETSTFGNYETNPHDAADPDAVLSDAYPCQNSTGVQLRWDNAESSSIFHSTNQNCSEYSWLKVSFQFQLDNSNRFDHMDALFLELSLNGGAEYAIISTWAYGVDAIASYGVCYQNTVEVSSSDFGLSKFTDAVRLRFRASANGKNDRIHVDDILFEGHSGDLLIR